MPGADAEVVVVGGGVVGCAVAHALARRGVRAVLLEAEGALALGASGTNSGILHTGFDSKPGELETRLILRAAALRGELLAELGVPTVSCGARLRPSGAQAQEIVLALAANAAVNGVETRLEADGSLRVPGEAVTDPIAFVEALAGAAVGGGARVCLNARVVAIEREGDGGLVVTIATGTRLRTRAIVNCAGLFADELAAFAGDRLPEIHPRKGEFLVFADLPGEPLREILLPAPSAIGKGVLVFPTVDGYVLAGPTARERTDKADWSVEPDAAELILARAQRMLPALSGRDPVGAYAGLRPAGRDANYVIEPSGRVGGLVHVAAIRSTGLSASPAIGEHVAAMLEQQGAITLAGERALPAPPPRADPLPWWRRAAARRRGAGGSSAAGRQR